MAVWFVGCLGGQKGPPSRAQIAERVAKVYLGRGNFGWPRATAICMANRVRSAQGVPEVPPMESPLWLTGDESNRPNIPRVLPKEPGRYSGNDVGGQLIFDLNDAIAQVELAFFQPLHLEQVGARRIVQGLNRRIEIAMLLAQLRQFRLELGFVFLPHGCRCTERFMGH